MRKQSKYKLMQKRIDQHESKRSKAFTDFLQYFNYEELQQKGLYGVGKNKELEEKFPITNFIVTIGLDRIYVTRALKNLESKSNAAARELLFEKYKEQELTVSYDDLLQEFRLKLLELEQEQLLDYKERSKETRTRTPEQELEYIQILNILWKDLPKVYELKCSDKEQEQAFFKALFGSVTKYLYEHKSKQKKHISYDVLTNDGRELLIDMCNRRELAKLVDRDKLQLDKKFNRFCQYTLEKAPIKERRKIVLDSLLDGLTYRDISDISGYSISVISREVVAIRASYKRFFGIHHKSAQELELIKFGKYGLIVHKYDIQRSKLYKLEHYHKQARTPYHFNLDFGRVNYFPFKGHERIMELEQEQEQGLIKALEYSSITPHKADFDRAQELYKYRQICKSKSTRTKALEYEQGIRQELKKLEHLKKKQELERSAIRYELQGDKIQVFYGKTFIHELPIAK